MAPEPIDVIRFVWRSGKRIAITLVGAALIAAGLAMLVLPGPGVLVIAAGFAVLGTEYVWAAMVLERGKRAAAAIGRRIPRGRRRVRS
jgi:hypothetical protein